MTSRKPKQKRRTTSRTHLGTRQPRRRLMLEALEDRRMLATFAEIGDLLT